MRLAQAIIETARDNARALGIVAMLAPVLYAGFELAARLPF